MNDDQVRSHLRALPTAQMPESVRSSVHAALAEPTNVIPITQGHRRRLRTLLVAAAAAAVLALVGLAEGPRPATYTASGPVMHAGAIFEPENFAATLRERFLGGAPAVSFTNTFADNPAALAECTRAVAAYGRLLGVDAGQYSSRPAVVLITSYPGNTEYEEIWVVTPTCSAADPAIMRHMLFDLDNSAASL